MHALICRVSFGAVLVSEEVVACVGHPDARFALDVHCPNARDARATQSTRLHCPNVPDATLETLVTKPTGALLVYLGIDKSDTLQMLPKMAQRLLDYRIFPDAAGKMRHSAKEMGADVLLVPQFTLSARTDKGLRPDFGGAMAPAVAREMFDTLAHLMTCYIGQDIQTGVFGADMQVISTNLGPSNFVLRL